MKIKVLLFAVLLVGPVFNLFAQIEQKRNVGNYTEVDLRIAGDVFITQGDHFEFVVKGRQKDLDDLITEVKGNSLIIKYDEWFGSHESVEIHIIMQGIEGLEVSGSGSIVAKSPINTNELDLEVSGSGTIVIDDLSANEVESEISGSGNIRLKGTKSIGRFESEISGSGKINCFDLPCENADIEISGSGKIEVMASKRLEAEVAGSGKIYYKGNPVVDAEITGSGKVVSAN